MPPRAPRTPEERFETARHQLLATEDGQEATMYGPLRDLFVEVLGYPAPSVDIDRSGARGRPDLTVFAPGAAAGARVAWIVLEAKDERGVCRDEARRAALFAAKSKYISADTAWFVMADPTTLVARPADRGADASTDLVLDLSGLDHATFLDRWAALKEEVAGVPQLLARFRDGDETLIATDRLTDTGDELAETLGLLPETGSTPRYGFSPVQEDRRWLARGSSQKRSSPSCGR